MRQTAVLLNPPFRRAVFRDHYCSSEAKATYLWHPLDLLIQGAFLKEAGWRVHGLDALALGLGAEETFRRVVAWRPDLLVVLVSERTWEVDRALVARLREAGVPTVAASGDLLRFGTGALAEVSPLIDLVLTDFTSPHLAASVAAGHPTGGGIATPAEVWAGQVRDLGRAPLHYPAPDPATFAPASYRLPYPGFTRFASILTTYGCPHHCHYCHVGELGARLRDPVEIVDEVASAAAAGVGQIYFRDATLNANRMHLVTWLDRLSRQGPVLPWAAFAAAAPFDADLAQRLYRAGCRHLQIGFETLDDALRDANHKPFDGEAHRAFVRWCNEAGIAVTAHLVLGLPGEDTHSLAATVRGVADAGFTYVAINLAEDRPGLPWQAQGRRLPVAPTGGAAAGAEIGLDVLRRHQAAAYRRFYLRPGRLLGEAIERLRHRDVADGVGLLTSAAGWVRPASPDR